MFQTRTALICVVLAATSCATPGQTPETDAPPPKTMREAMDRAAAPLLERRDPALPSLVVGVFRAGFTDWAVFGDASVTSTSLVRVASMTKPLTALLVASHVAEGSLSYEDAIGVSTCDPSKLSAFCFRGAATTYEHLVQHTAGMPVEPDNIAPGYAPSDLQDFLARFEVPIEPGKRFRYSTTGYAALGMALERRTREPFADALSTRVLAPLGLQSMTFAPAADALVPGYEDGELAADAAQPPALWPAVGIAASAEALLRLAEHNLNPRATPALAEAIILTQRVSSEIDTFQGSKAAHGWFYNEAADTFWHAGSTRGANVFLAFSPNEGAAVVLLTNTTLPDDGRLMTAGFELLRTLPDDSDTTIPAGRL